MFTDVMDGGITNPAAAASRGLDRVLDDGLMAVSCRLLGVDMELIDMGRVIFYSFFMAAIKN
jgi:hypothetical protein